MFRTANILKIATRIARRGALRRYPRRLVVSGTWYLILASVLCAMLVLFGYAGARFAALWRDTDLSTPDVRVVTYDEELVMQALRLYRERDRAFDTGAEAVRQWEVRVPEQPTPTPGMPLLVE